MLTMVNSTQIRANHSKARMVALAVAQDEIDKQRALAKKNTPQPGLVSSVLNGVTGLLTTATMKLNITAVAGVPKLFNVTVEVQYDDQGSKVSLSTKVRSS
jgi:hypothetical protein